MAYAVIVLNKSGLIIELLNPERVNSGGGLAVEWLLGATACHILNQASRGRYSDNYSFLLSFRQSMSVGKLIDSWSMSMTPVFEG